MKVDEILQEIKKKGRFVYVPTRWDDETDASLNELGRTGRIRSSSTKEEAMNGDYIYRAGSRDQ